MEYAKRISIFFAAMGAVLLPMAATAAHRSEARQQALALERDQTDQTDQADDQADEARAAAAMAIVVGIGVMLMHAPEDEAG